MTTQDDANKIEDSTTPNPNEGEILTQLPSDLSDSGVERGTGASVGWNEIVGTGVNSIEDDDGAKVAFGQHINSALRANSQSSEVAFNWMTISLAIPQVVSSENGIMADSSIVAAPSSSLLLLQNSHFFSSTGAGGGGEGAVVCPDAGNTGGEVPGGKV